MLATVTVEASLKAEPAPTKSVGALMAPVTAAAISTIAIADDDANARATVTMATPIATIIVVMITILDDDTDAAAMGASGIDVDVSDLMHSRPVRKIHFRGGAGRCCRGQAQGASRQQNGCSNNSHA